MLYSEPKNYSYPLTYISESFGYSKQGILQIEKANNISFEIIRNTKLYDINDFVVLFMKLLMPKYDFVKKIDCDDVYFALSRNEEIEYSLEEIIKMIYDYKKAEKIYNKKHHNEQRKNKST